MSEFNKLERAVANSLERFPRMRSILKETYKRIIYLCYRNKDFCLALHPDVSIYSPQKWAGLQECDGEWFFGYYDKSPWSADMERAVFHQINGQGISVMVVDRKAGKQYSVGNSRAWNQQQGSMAQWLRGEKNGNIIFNTFDGEVLGSQFAGIKEGKRRFIPWPIQTLHPSGCEALSLNYRRLSILRPEYGYSGNVKNFSPTQNLEQDGIWKVDLNSGSGVLVLSLAELVQHKPVPEMEEAQHKVNHLIYSPSGSRFVFLHRFIAARGKFSRLYVAPSKGSGLQLLLDDRMVSHYYWKDDDHILVWGRIRERGDHYYLVNVRTGESDIIGQGVLDIFGDGHCSFSPNGRWIVTDTYPDRARHQRLILFDTHSQKLEVVGRFFSPWSFTDLRRCDLHPRWSPDGKWVSIDSGHEGLRRTYFVDVGAIVGDS